MKRCGTCHKNRPRSQYAANPRNPDGHNRTCERCRGRAGNRPRRFDPYLVQPRQLVDWHTWANPKATR